MENQDPVVLMVADLEHEIPTVNANRSYGLIGLIDYVSPRCILHEFGSY